MSEVVAVGCFSWQTPLWGASLPMIAASDSSLVIDTCHTIMNAVIWICLGYRVNSYQANLVMASCSFRALLLCIVLRVCTAGKGAADRKLPTTTRQRVLEHGSVDGEDVATATDEAQWYDAEQHPWAVTKFIKSWKGDRTLHVLDMFGASARIKSRWTVRKYSGMVLDILVGGQNHDVTSKGGFYFALEQCLAMRPGGLCVAGPPCSLFGFLSISVSKRTIANPEGDVSNFKVRLSNQIVRNTAVLLKVLMQRSVYIMVEQPSNSYMFKLPCMLSIVGMLGITTVMTWMICYGHDMPKPTHLLTNLPSAYKLRRQYSNKQRGSGKTYVKDYLRRLPGGRVCGGKRLSEAAAYPHKFCEAVFLAWESDRLLQLAK